jgi:hypothetical protein
MNSSFGGSARCVDLASCVDPRAVECPGMVDTDAPPPVDTSVADLCVSVSPSPSSLSLSTTVPSSRARGVTVRWPPRPVGVVGSRPSGEGCVGVVSPTSMRPDGDVIMLGDVPRVRTAGRVGLLLLLLVGREREGGMDLPRGHARDPRARRRVLVRRPRR